MVKPISIVSVFNNESEQVDKLWGGYTTADDRGGAPGVCFY